MKKIVVGIFLAIKKKPKDAAEIFMEMKINLAVGIFLVFVNKNSFAGIFVEMKIKAVAGIFLEINKMVAVEI